jgi:hypothetical protein
MKKKKEEEGIRVSFWVVTNEEKGGVVLWGKWKSEK